MKILITGATGLIGQELVVKLLNADHEVNVLTRNIKQTSKKFNSHKINLFEWKNINDNLPNDAFTGIDVVVNLMGENIGAKRWTASQKEKLYSSRITATKNIIKKLNELELDHVSFIGASAIGFYPVNQQDEIDESFKKGDNFLANLCHDWESCLNLLSPLSRKVIIRTGVVLSSSGGALQKMLLPFKLGLGGPIGNGEQVISWIHIDDIVNLYFQAIVDKNFNGIYNATSPNPVSNLIFTKELGKSLRRPTLFPIPRFFIKLIFGEMSTIILDSQKVLPKRLLKEGFAFKYPDLQSAFNNINK